MVMVSTTLASELENMTPESDENVVIDRFAFAWETYFYEYRQTEEPWPAQRPQ